MREPWCIQMKGLVREPLEGVDFVELHFVRERVVCPHDGNRAGAAGVAKGIEAAARGYAGTIAESPTRNEMKGFALSLNFIGKLIIKAC